MPAILNAYSLGALERLEATRNRRPPTSGESPISSPPDFRVGFFRIQLMSQSWDGGYACSGQRTRPG